MTKERTRTDKELREWIESTVEYLLFEEALARFDGARYLQGLTPAQMRVLIATANLPQSLRSKLAGVYSEKYERGAPPAGDTPPLG